MPVLCLALSFLAAPLRSGAEPAGPILSCEPVGNARPICGFKNPEDLAPLPGDEALLVSEDGEVEGGQPGALALLVLATTILAPALQLPLLCYVLGPLRFGRRPHLLVMC